MVEEDLAKLKIDKSGSAIHMARRRRPLQWVVALLLVIIVAFLYMKGVLTPAVEVEVSTVSRIYPSQTLTLLNASGYVVAERKAAVASKITSSLISLTVEEGSHVKAGQIIARLEGNDAVAARDQSVANLRVAKTNLEQANAELNDATLAYNRDKALVNREYIARADYDTAEARFLKAKAAVAGAEAAIKAASAALQGANVALEYTLIRAPFDAVVLTKDADVGDIITPLGAAANAKAAVVTLADMNSLEVEADVSESNLQLVKIGQPCELQLDALPEARFRGAVHMIVPTADRSKATVMVKVRFIDKDARILPEMSAKVAFLSREVAPDEEKPRLALNPAAIRDHNGGKIVFLIKDARAVETPVTVGPAIGDMMEVLAGVKAGDKIVIKPLDRLKNGDKIKVAEK
ncbi:MAG: efflux RND transporter periplasmic adaptor subunit [Dissulfurispiraceae bacterium]